MAGGGGLHWVMACTGRVPTASVRFPHQHDWVQPRLSGLTAPQTPDEPEPHQGTGEREILPCRCGMPRAPQDLWGVQGTGSMHQLYIFCLNRAVVLLSA